MLFPFDRGANRRGTLSTGAAISVAERPVIRGGSRDLRGGIGRGDRAGYEHPSDGGDRVDSKLIRLVITESREEIRVGDRLLPVHESGVPARFQLGQPDFLVDDAHIIAARSGKTHIGTSDVVVVNRGHRDSLKAGDLWPLIKQGRL